MKPDDDNQEQKGVGAMPPSEEAPASSAVAIPHAPGQIWVEDRTRVGVGRGASVSGRLIFHEPVRIEGHFRGEVSATDLVVIAEGGSIHGRVRATRMLVLGELRGDLAGCERAVLGPRSRFYGRIETASLVVCEGAYIDGDVRMPKASLRPASRSA